MYEACLKFNDLYFISYRYWPLIQVFTAVLHWIFNKIPSVVEFFQYNSKNKIIIHLFVTRMKKSVLTFMFTENLCKDLSSWVRALSIILLYTRIYMEIWFKSWSWSFLSTSLPKRKLHKKLSFLFVIFYGNEDKRLNT